MCVCIYIKSVSEEVDAASTQQAEAEAILFRVHFWERPGLSQSPKEELPSMTACLLGSHMPSLLHGCS